MMDDDFFMFYYKSILCQFLIIIGRIFLESHKFIIKFQSLVQIGTQENIYQSTIMNVEKDLIVVNLVVKKNLYIFQCYLKQNNVLNQNCSKSDCSFYYNIQEKKQNRINLIMDALINYVN
ncbi:unnamed protein product [Paramecium sonneborni]|uniref:Transmembrane protein n=1 Tax=Paramecium sonneborni TaxID=65129 RepID=A0A8S1MDI3_9CILI|nr:unnamed protein product [Paramecium sonneborni]